MVLRFVVAAFLLLATAASAAAQDRAAPSLRLMDSGGRPAKALEAGASYEAGARGLAPDRLYEFRLTLGDRLVSYARLRADRKGEVGDFVLWYQSGVVGCALEAIKADAPRPAPARAFAFHDVEEAERALAGRQLELTVRDAPPPRRKVATGVAEAIAQGPVLARLVSPVVKRSSPMVFPSTGAGCMLNSAEAGTRDMYVSGRNFSPGETLQIAVVPNQRQWHVGDAIDDVTGVSGAAALKTVHADAAGRFTTKVWDKGLQRRGAYDVITRRITVGTVAAGAPKVRAVDVATYAHDTAYILFLYYPPGGSQMDIAGRPLPHAPYYQFADSFADTGDDVWGAVDPTYVPMGHTGGTYAAYYVVNHKSDVQWAMDPSLADVSGGAEVHPVKAGCINGTDTIIWHAPVADGAYDVVVNFGSVAANSQAAFVDDFTYDSAVDFLDGAVQIGFRVAPDPYQLGPTPIGTASYSFDDALFLSNSVSTFEGGAPGSTNVDLRAVIRYPATMAGANQPVAPGVHPIFIMEHGNHYFCDVFAATHAACPVNQRKLNHEGYMHLLDDLASHGIIAVSIDAYDLTAPGYPQWIPERGDLILKHLEFWSHLNNAAAYPTYMDPFGGLFTGHVDLSKISVSGHSRGGEASVSSWVRNQLRPPAQQFSIGSVSSIAPVDGQGYVLGDVPYFVILPASDCDVSDLSGARIYDRAGTATGQTVKSGIDVYGADHNFFNTVWAADGDDCPNALRNDYINAGDQQKIGEAYLAAFIRSQLLGEDIYEDMLRHRMTFPSTAGFKIYGFRHEKAHKTIDDGTAAGAAGGGATAVVVANPSVHQTSADKLDWSAWSQTYGYSMAPTDVSTFEVLSFRVAQTNAGTNPLTGQDFAVRLTGAGHTSETYVGQFDPVPPPYDRGWGASNQNVMTTVRVPLHSFIINQSGVDLTAIDKVEIVFRVPTQGEVYVDDVEFSR
jgi:hypothetical protein